MSLRCFLPALLLGLVTLSGALQAAKPAAAPYRSAIIVDAASGVVLFEDQADRVNAPASVTKLMTFLIVHDQIASGRLTLQTPVTVTKEDSAIGGTQVWLEAGESFSVDELLFALMIQSANDAAHALARAASGSREAFVARMNERARGLGMVHTTFRTPHGLPASSRKLADGDVSAARDLALLSRQLLLHTNILDYTSVKQRTFRPGQPAPREVIMRSHNHLLRRVKGVDGLKTGYTASAGFCLAATAERDRRRVIVVVLGSPDTKTRDIKVAELLEKGFTLIPTTSVFQSQGANPFVSSPAPVPIAPAPSGTRAKPTTADPLPTVKFVAPKR